MCSTSRSSQRTLYFERLNNSNSNTRAFVGGGDFALVRAFLTGIWKSWPKPSRSDEAVSSKDGNDKQADMVAELTQTSEAVPGKEQADDDDRGPEAWKRYLPTPKETLRT